MPLNTENFNTLVANQVAAAQASSSQLLDFSNGSVLLALIQANTTGVALWLQALDIYILSLTRASTSNGADLDSWMADFGFARLPALYASGQVTFSRLIDSIQAVIPVGTIVQTTSGSASFTVIVDTTNGAYSAALNGFVITANTASITVTVDANTAGTIGNVGSSTINVINSPIAYVDSVINSSSFTNGANAESDASYRTRFINYLSSLSKATLSAIENAIQQVPGVSSYTITENADYNGTTDYGYFYVVVDNGTGSPSGGFLALVNNAIELVRGFCIRFGVFAPITTTANVVMTVTVATGYLHSIIAPIVQTAIQEFIGELVIGQSLYYSQLFQVAYDASPGVLDVSSYTLNSGTSDVTANNQHIIEVGTVTIN